jgi:Txe/YoeB family toxin of Txe-Axe toxin-antitoxin module
MKFIETRVAVNDKKKIKSMSNSVKLKFENLIIDIINNPREIKTIGNPEQLKYSEIELWSRELSKKDRIVYGIEPGFKYDLTKENEVIVFYQYLGHYTDK